MKLNLIAEEIKQCKACPLHQTEGKYVPGEGNPNAEVVFIGEAPGKSEAEQGRPFVGRSGKLLDNMIKAMGFDRSDVFIVNINKCRPPNNRKPTTEEMKACEPFLHRQLEALNPKVIVTLGATAMEGILGKGLGITKRRGTWDQYRGIKVMPTFHPAFCLRNPKSKHDVWDDLQQVMKEIGKI